MDFASSDEEPLSVQRRRRLNREVTLRDDRGPSNGISDSVARSRQTHKHMLTTANMARNTTPPDTPWSPSLMGTLYPASNPQPIGPRVNGVPEPCRFFQPRPIRVAMPSDELSKLWPSNSLTGAVNDLYGRVQKVEKEALPKRIHLLKGTVQQHAEVARKKQEATAEVIRELRRSVDEQERQARLDRDTISAMREGVRKLQESNEEKEVTIRSLAFQMAQMNARVADAINPITTATKDVVRLKLDVKGLKTAGRKSDESARKEDTKAPVEKQGALKLPTAAKSSPVASQRVSLFKPRSVLEVVDSPTAAKSTVPSKRAAGPATEPSAKRMSLSVSRAVLESPVKPPAETPSTPFDNSSFQSSPGAASTKKPHSPEPGLQRGDGAPKKVSRAPPTPVSFMRPVTHPETASAKSSPTTPKPPGTVWSAEGTKCSRKGVPVKVSSSVALRRGRGLRDRFVEGLGEGEGE